MKPVIIAKTHAQARQYAQEHGLGPGYSAITSKHDLEMLFGLENPDVRYLACPDDVDPAKLDALLASRRR